MQFGVTTGRAPSCISTQTTRPCKGPHFSSPLTFSLLFPYEAFHVSGTRNHAMDTLSTTGLIFSPSFHRPPNPTIPTVAASRHVPLIDLLLLEVAVQRLFEFGLASLTRSSYSQHRNTTSSFALLLASPLPLFSLSIHCFTGQQGSAGLLAVRHLQISIGLPLPPTNSWTWLHYGIKRSQNQPQWVRLPITISILK